MTATATACFLAGFWCLRYLTFGHFFKPTCLVLCAMYRQALPSAPACLRYWSYLTPNRIVKQPKPHGLRHCSVLFSTPWPPISVPLTFYFGLSQPLEWIFGGFALNAGYWRVCSYPSSEILQLRAAVLSLLISDLHAPSTCVCGATMRRDDLGFSGIEGSDLVCT